MGAKHTIRVRYISPKNGLVRVLVPSQVGIKQYAGFVPAPFYCICRDGSICACDQRPTRPPATPEAIAAAKELVAKFQAGLAEAEAELAARETEEREAAAAAAKAQREAAQRQLEAAESKLEELGAGEVKHVGTGEVEVQLAQPTPVEYGDIDSFGGTEAPPEAPAPALVEADTDKPRKKGKR